MIIALFPSHGQDEITVKEGRLRNQYGLEKLQNLVELARYFDEKDSRKCLRYSRQGDQLANNILRTSDKELGKSDWQLIVDAKEVYGIVQYKRRKYLESREAFLEAYQFASAHSAVNSSEAATYLEKIDSLASVGVVKDNLFKSALREINLDAAFKNSSNNMSVTVELQRAKSAEKEGDTAAAIGYYQQAARYLRNGRSVAKAEQIEAKIKHYQDMQALRNSMMALPEISPATNLPLSDVLRIDSDSSKRVVEQVQTQAKALEAKGDYKAALDYYQQYLSMQLKLQKDSAQRLALLKETEVEMERLRQENELADLNIATIQLEKQSEENQKNAMMVVTATVVLAIAVITFFYLGRVRKHRALSKAYESLDKTRTELEEAERSISRLLQQQVSPDIAEALIGQRTSNIRKVVTVMFLDIRGFTPKAEGMAADQLIDYQNRVFGFMIDIVNTCNGNINQFLGDGFMATFGAPKSYGNDAENAVNASLQILERLHEANDTGKIPYTEVGIGLNTGEVVTGNVGTESRKQFSITGSTVIVAARIEQLNKVYNSNLILSDTTMKALKTLPNAEHEYAPNEVNLKGRSGKTLIHVMKKSLNQIQIKHDERAK